MSIYSRLIDGSECPTARFSSGFFINWHRASSLRICEGDFDFALVMCAIPVERGKYTHHLFGVLVMITHQYIRHWGKTGLLVLNTKGDSAPI